MASTSTPQPEDAEPPKASVMVEALRDVGASHVVGMPDNASAALFAALAEDAEIDVIQVTREGEAFAIASGLWVGGMSPVVLVQNTGLLESGDGLRGTAMRMGVPLLCIVTYRGIHTLPNRRPTRKMKRPTREVLVRSDIDSAAVVTEPTLEAWGIPFNYYESDDHHARIRDAWLLARTEDRPVVLLVTNTLT